MPIIRDIPQRWWEIICTYDGTPGFRAMSVGETQQEAEANFKDSIDSPELAAITAITPIGVCTAAQVMEQTPHEENPVSELPEISKGD